MIRSTCDTRFRFAILAVLLIWSETAVGQANAPPAPDVRPRSIQGDWDALKPVADDDGIDLRAAEALVEKVKKRWGYFKATTENIRKEFARRGFVTIPKWRVGIVPDAEGAPRAETPTFDLTYVNGNLLAELETDLTSTLTHEGFHLVQINSRKAMVSRDGFLTKWVDESTATWMQYTVGPDSAVMRQRTADVWPDDFDAHYFSWQSAHHPYSCFHF
jgi:hypothetical protein